MLLSHAKIEDPHEGPDGVLYFFNETLDRLDPFWLIYNFGPRVSSVSASETACVGQLHSLRDVTFLFDISDGMDIATRWEAELVRWRAQNPERFWFGWSN